MNDVQVALKNELIFRFRNKPLVFRFHNKPEVLSEKILLSNFVLAPVWITNIVCFFFVFWLVSVKFCVNPRKCTIFMSVCKC